MSNRNRELTMTVESKIVCDEVTKQSLESYAGYYAYLEHVMFNYIFEHQSPTNKEINAFKSGFLTRYGIPGRTFNTLMKESKAKLSALKETHVDNLTTMKKQLAQTEKSIKHFDKLLKRGYRKYKKQLSTSTETKDLQKKMFNLLRKRDRLRDRIKEHRLNPIMFGTKDFYQKQWTDDKYKSDHESWLCEWRRRRNEHFYLIGSHEETAHNSMCQYKKTDDGEYLHVTVPEYLLTKLGKHVKVPVRFESDREYHNKNYYDYFHQAMLEDTPMTYRFLCKEDGFWYVHATFTIPKQVQPGYNGYLGVDINSCLLATAEVDSKGNYIGVFKNYTYDTKDKTTEQLEQIVTAFIIDIVRRAKLANRIVVIEDIDLKNKKSGRFSLVNKKINDIPYATITTLITNRCLKENVYLKIVNPAYTSVIGKHKYAKRYGLSIHNAAAIVIARRGNYFSKERVPVPMAYVLHSGEENEWETICGHNHHWKHWSFLSKNLEKCLTKVNSCRGGAKALTMNILTSRFKPVDWSFINGCRIYVPTYVKEYSSI